jgi:parvulin-like peptidyl-prolyl isomerase
MAKDKTPKVPTLNRKRLVGLERERYLNRILLIATFVIVGAVVILVGWGSLNQFIVGPNRPVAVVEGREILGREFQSLAKINRTQLVNSYVQYVQTMQFFGNDPNFQQQAFTQLQQLQYQLIPSVNGEQTVNQMVDDELLKLEGEALGITVSQAEIDEQFESFMGYFPNGTPTSEIADTPIATSTLSSTQLAIVTITPTALPSFTPTATLINLRTPSPMPTHIVINTPPPPATSTPLATATPFTESGYATAVADYFALQGSELGITREDIDELIYMNLLREKVRDYLRQSVPHTVEQVWARHILVADEAAAQDVLDRLAAGEDWAALAAELSTDTSNSFNGGDLGWFDRQTMVEPFANAAFELEIGETSEPVETDFGWHIIQVLGHEQRPLDFNQYEEALNQALADLILSLREKYDWEIFDTWRDLSPTEPRIPPQYMLQ